MSPYVSLTSGNVGRFGEVPSEVGGGRGGELARLCASVTPVAIELVIARLATTEPGPARHGFFSEAGTAEDGGAAERSFAAFVWQPFLLLGNLLPDFDRRDGDDLFVHQIGAGEVAVERWAALAEQILHSEIGA